MLVSVSFINNPSDESKTIQRINKSNADFIHVDIMDGVFVPEKNYEYQDISKWVKDVDKPLDIHLMVNDLKKYLDQYLNLKPEYLTFHVELPNVLKNIKYLKNKGIKVGLAINPETAVSTLKPFLPFIDLVLVMSVNPGMGGQKFKTKMLNKVKLLRNWQKKYHYLISIDGGVNATNIKFIDTDMVVSGSYVCFSSDMNKAINKLKLK
jgi:ribulose-phosphate 3-epimerase